MFLHRILGMNWPTTEANDRRQEGVNVPRALELLALKSCPRSFLYAVPSVGFRQTAISPVSHGRKISPSPRPITCVCLLVDQRVERGSRVLRCFSPVPQHEEQTCQRVHPPAEVSPRPNPCSDIYETLKHYILVATLLCFLLCFVLYLHMARCWLPRVNLFSARN